MLVPDMPLFDTDTQMEDDEMLAYLLGTLPEEKRVVFDLRYFSDPAVFEQLEAWEEELIQDYVRQRLSAEVKTILEQRIALDPILRRKIAEAAAFARAVKPSPHFAPSASWRRPAWLIPAACAALLLLAVTIWFAGRRQARNPVTIAHRSAKNSPAYHQPINPEASSSTSVLALILDPGVFRGGSEKTVQLSQNVKSLQLTLRGDAILPPLRYQVALHSESGVILYSVTASPNQKQKELTVVIPAKLLKTGHNRITVSGTNPDDTADYSLTIRR